MAERPGPNDPQPHGSPAARQRHLAHGEELCWECRQASADLVVVCAGRPVNDWLEPVMDAERCTKRFRPPWRLRGGGLGRQAHVDRLISFPPQVRHHSTLYDLRPATGGEVVQMARAAGWAVGDGQDPAGGELVGTCPVCRRPAPEVVALVKERKRINDRSGGGGA